MSTHPAPLSHAPKAPSGDTSHRSGHGAWALDRLHAVVASLILCAPLMLTAQRNIIGEYSTVHKYSWGSGLELTLRADSTFGMSNHELVGDGTAPFRTVTGTWTTLDSTRTLVLNQSVDSNATLTYEFPFIDHHRMLAMLHRDSAQADSALASHALEFYPMVLYKVKGYYPDGTVECELPRTIGENPDYCPPTGTWKFYFTDGVLEQEVDHTGAKGRIISREYHKNGVLKAERSWQEDLQDGTWKYYDETGKLIMTEVYKKGQLKKTLD